jgi:hypothetical protein
LEQRALADRHVLRTVADLSCERFDSGTVIAEADVGSDSRHHLGRAAGGQPRIQSGLDLGNSRRIGLRGRSREDHYASGEHQSAHL